MVDKPEVDLKSPNMVRLALKRSLEHFKNCSITIDELVTDASIVIISMMGEFSSQFQ